MQNFNKMNSGKILHVMVVEKFLAPYIDFVDEHFGREGHHYVFITSEKYQYGLTPEHKVEFLHTDDDIFIILLAYMKMAKKIILHGLWRDKVDVLLYFNQELLKKCYWAMWGGDFYFPETKNKIRHKIIKNIGYLLSQVEGDVQLVRKWYGAKGEHIMLTVGYPSNIYRDHKTQFNFTVKRIVNIQVGNSATATNRHREIFEKLLPFKGENIKIYAPLSYGNREYAQQVAVDGKKLFGDKFVPMFEFLTFDEYVDFLLKMDLAIFNHDRQQAFGNIITLLGFGKKVYLNPESTIYDLMQKMRIKIFNICDIDLTLIKNEEKKANLRMVKKCFSIENLLKDSKLYLL